MLPKPDFFIVGAPKSGTTAMYEYLRLHPEIYFPDLKEPYFFGSDLTYRTPRLSRDEYLNLFAPASGVRRIGEASVTYLYSRLAAKEIKEFNENAKIIIMLRNPIEMIYALHSQVVFSGIEDITDFQAALDAENERKRGERIPSKCHIVDFLYYRDFVRYADQVKRYRDIFGENVWIILFDDFKKNVEGVYKDTLRFLDVDFSFQPNTFRVINQNKTHRNKWLIQLLQHPKVVQSTRFLIPSYTWRQHLAEHVKRLTFRETKRTPMPEFLKKQLQEEFRGDIERLEEVIGRDLSVWYID